jgi:hypothetical protein
MASLTEASILSRKIIRYGLYALILIVVGRFAWIGIAAVYRRINPPEPPKASAAFGKLPLLPFPEKPQLQNISYKIETAEGGLPVLPELMSVYEMPQAQSSIQGLEAAKTKAQSFGFNPQGQLLVESVPNVYLFRRNGRPSSFTINIITGVFSISYDIASDPGVLGQLPPAPSPAVDNAHNFLRQADLDQVDLDGKETIQLLRVENGRFVPAISLSEAQVTKVNIFRKNYGVKEDVPAVTPDMPEANVWFMFSGRSNEVIAAEYHYFPLNEKVVETYSIKTSETAFEELKSGKAYIANPGAQASNEVVIRKVYSAYYDPGQYTPYYQPVIVFEGDGGFYAYVPAILDEYYGKE